MLIQGRLLVDPHTPPDRGWIRIESGRIAEIGWGDPPGLVNFGDGETLITPGFIDAHCHLSQFGAIGCDGLDLIGWLDQVIFPEELRWGDAATAQRQIDAAHQRLLFAGTLGYAGYLTTHAHAVGCAVESLRRWPLRAIVGQVLMDRAGPSGLLGHAITPLRAMQNPRLTLSTNPRFAVACSESLLRTAAGLAGDVFPIQTHLAESQRECEIVQRVFADCPTYTEVYDRAGLLTNRTLLAHGVHLQGDEWSLIAKRGSVVVHCPGANTFLQSGLFDLRAAREHGVRVALGSDVAAGPDLAMPRVARSMIEAAKLRRMTIDASAIVPDPAEAWEMITRGNADALGWTDAGRLETGATADLLLLRPTFALDEHLIGRLIYGWEESMIVGRVVAGAAWPPTEHHRSGT